MDVVVSQGVSGVTVKMWLAVGRLVCGSVPTLKMETAGFSVMLVTTYQTTRCQPRGLRWYHNCVTIHKGFDSFFFWLFTTVFQAFRKFETSGQFSEFNVIWRSGLLIYDRLSESVHVDTNFTEIVSCGNVWNDSDSKCLNLVLFQKCSWCLSGMPLSCNRFVVFGFTAVTRLPAGNWLTSP